MSHSRSGSAQEFLTVDAHGSNLYQHTRTHVPAHFRRSTQNRAYSV